ncbi:hypothetical protein A2763_03760 [Candidatus Kaiserbacteria bacterium RIFCSPHIGHO2_01_FULL_54_36]|uniref:Uncharacterized protein n=1 Tax=Candidatus Kaiserbacteria bacterium RIFCSPHIGHO2_01_FULL_54_36 TaxID=1798482 RepID=A0A1F6CLB7_9BACT|nr:MAG: hypothetical protein A2763_03760 [Candidatus Kaiserbacteria bacterium RIFCSPHIGHO2_01_FULL_54_36]
MQTFFRHKWIVVIIAILVAGVAWYAMSPADETPNVAPTVTAGAGAPVEQGIVATLLTLRAVKLDGTIFSDQAFLSLRDFSTEIVPEPVGRPNPFAPLSSQARASENSTKGAQIFTQPRR